MFDTAVAAPTPTVGSSNDLRLFVSGDGYNATAVLQQGQFLVLKGSIARLKEAPSLGASSRALREELLASKVLEKAAAGLCFTQDYAFDSPSGAAQAINGANVSGRRAWRLADGRTFKEWQDSQLPADTA